MKLVRSNNFQGLKLGQSHLYLILMSRNLAVVFWFQNARTQINKCLSSTWFLIKLNKWHKGQQEPSLNSFSVIANKGKLWRKKSRMTLLTLFERIILQTIQSCNLGSWLMCWSSVTQNQIFFQVSLKDKANSAVVKGSLVCLMIKIKVKGREFHSIWIQVDRSKLKRLVRKQ